MSEIIAQPTLKQMEVIEALEEKDEVFFGGAAGGGKSWLICETRLINCYKYPGYRSFIGRNELKDLRGSTYLTWRKVCRFHGIPESDWGYNGIDSYIEFNNGSRIDLLALRPTPKDPELDWLGSFEFSDGSLEECGEIDEVAYQKVLTRIGRHLNKELGIRPTLLMTGNPKKNWMYHTFYIPWKNNELKPYQHFVQSLATENPYIEESYIEALKRQPLANRQRLLEGNWEYQNSPDTLIEFEAIESIWMNEHLPDGEKYITADIATTGNDLLVIMVWSGFRVIEIKTMNKSNGEEILRMITSLADKHEVRRKNIVYDAVAVGEYLAGMIKFSTPFKSNMAAPPGTNYKTLKDRCAYALARRIENRGIYIQTEKHKEEIIKELEQLKSYKVDEETKLQVMPKKLIKKAIGRSPDFLDCLIMREYLVTNRTGRQKARTILS